MFNALWHSLFAFESLGGEFFLALWPLWNQWVTRFTVRAEALARRTETFETIFADFSWDRQFSWRQSKRGWSKELESLVKSKSKLFRPSFAALSDQGFSLSEYLHLLAGPRTTGRSAQVRISVVLVDAHDSYDRLVFLATAKRQPQTAPCLRAIFASLTRFPIPSGQWAQAYQRTVRASRSFQPCKVDQGGMWKDLQQI